MPENKKVTDSTDRFRVYLSIFHFLQFFGSQIFPDGMFATGKRSPLYGSFLANQTLWPRGYNVCYVYDSYILSAVNSP